MEKEREKKMKGKEEKAYVQGRRLGQGAAGAPGRPERNDSSTPAQLKVDDVAVNGEREGDETGVKIEKISLNGAAYSRNLLRRLGYWEFFKFLILYLSGYRTSAIALLGRSVIQPRGLTGLALDSLTHSTSEICSVFHLFADPNNYPILVHCTQGKDRTGLIVILLLLLLEVNVDAIRYDYMLSEGELEGVREERVAQVRRIGLGEEFGRCEERLVEDVREELSRGYEGVEGYLEGIGVGMMMQSRIRGLLMR